MEPSQESPGTVAQPSQEGSVAPPTDEIPRTLPHGTNSSGAHPSQQQGTLESPRTVTQPLTKSPRSVARPPQERTVGQAQDAKDCRTWGHLQCPATLLAELE